MGLTIIRPVQLFGLVKHLRNVVILSPLRGVVKMCHDAVVTWISRLSVATSPQISGNALEGEV
ncbi:protein of unknown function [Candidatus Methylomirabilis oxygeniifera]|uniref:Uncharacterized protein n=1 Tax=Methylomirabilis oxygeniifera TaxID=671143 RepID=D5MMP2_METO1|nr:protein of unknown function [Candidatus Methylomirabilis oxyfera]